MRTDPLPIRQLIAIAAACVFATSGRAQAQTANPAQGTISGGSYKLAGTVVNKINASPLALARITVTDAKNSQKTAFAITSENGKFEFTGLPAGKYSLTGEKRGFVTAGYDQHEEFSTAIVTGAGLDTE